MSAWLKSSQIADIFAEEIVAADGKVTDSCTSKGSLFARGVLPPHIAVAANDKLQGGVAVRATDADIFVHPYVFRLVCSNGAVMARTTQTRHIGRDAWLGEAEGDLETTLREAIRCCCEPEAFIASADQMRSARELAADHAITIAAFMSSHRGSLPAPFLQEILSRYDGASDRSAYGLMNAVTSVARDTPDPEMKWRLEEIGGGIPALLRHSARPARGRARGNVRSLVEVG